jgi:hypothetical protein
MHGTPVISQGWPRPVLLNSYQASLQKFQGNTSYSWSATCVDIAISNLDVFDWSEKSFKFQSLITYPLIFCSLSRHWPILWGSFSHGKWEPAYDGTKPCTACAAIPGHSSDHASFCNQHVSRQIHVKCHTNLIIRFRWKNLGLPLGFRGTHLRGLAVFPTLLIHLLVAGHCPSFYWEDLQRLL